MALAVHTQEGCMSEREREKEGVIPNSRKVTS